MGTPSEDWLQRLAGGRVIQQDDLTGMEQMAVDDALGRQGRPAVRLFRWRRPALSGGFRQPWPGTLALDRLREAGVELVERPTGGGVAVHGTDLSFSVTVPTEGGAGLHGAMEAVCEVTAGAMRAVGLPAEAVGEGMVRARVDWCVTSPGSPYAILVRGRKVGGLAARRYPSAWLVQGSVLLRPIGEGMLGLLPAAVAGEVQRHAVQHVAGCPVDEAMLVQQLLEMWRGVSEGVLEAPELAHAV